MSCTINTRNTINNTVNTDNNYYVKRVLIEHLPLLRCYNIYIQYAAKSRFYDNYEQQPAQVRCTSVAIFLDRTRIELPAQLRLNVVSISRYYHRPGRISFRVCAERAEPDAAAPKADDDGDGDGDGVAELLMRPMPAGAVDSMRQPWLGPARPRQLPKPSVQAGEFVEFFCGDCGQTITGGVRFERVLPLPSDNVDASEWFCHGPGGQCKHNAKAKDVAAKEEKPSAKSFQLTSNASRIADMRRLDLLYGHYYVLMKRELLNAGMGVRLERFLHCECGEKLGEVYEANGTAKLWNDEVTQAPVKAYGSKIPFRQQLFPGKPERQFVAILRQVIEDFDSIMSAVAMPQTIRCMFTSVSDTNDEFGALTYVTQGTLAEAKAAHRANPRKIVTAFQRCLLFVQVMNRELDVWVSDQHLSMGECGGHSGGDQQFRGHSAGIDDSVMGDGRATLPLTRRSVLKIMYKYVHLTDGTPLPAMAEQWRDDVTVNCVELSDRMMLSAVMRIADNAKLLPSEERAPLSDGFRISYLW